MMYQPIIGLEIHVQLKTRRKMFCGCSADIWEAKPNSHTCPVCLGLPGALPVPNKKAIEQTQLMGLALNCELNLNSKFDRKSYFYPDLPKGYQISQYDLPLAGRGWLELEAAAAGIITANKRPKIRIRRVHLEEDTAKSIHKKDFTLINFNKSGIPLMEIVTEPELRSANEAMEFGKKIQQIVRWIGVSEADMEKGNMRLELNISMRKISNSKAQAHDLPNYKVEVKNINSFRFLGQAIEYEIKRQTELLKNREQPVQENRGFNDVEAITVVQRAKETEADYRYFPEPDIPPLEFSREYVKALKSKLPTLPDELVGQYIKKYNLSKKVADKLVRRRKTSDYFIELVKLDLNPIKAANLVINRPEVLQIPAEDTVRIEEKQEAEIIASEHELKVVIQKVVDQNRGPVAEYQAGKEATLKFLVGQVMRATGGKASPQVTQNLLKKHLA